MAAETFTREQILDVIALEPCHVTGMHEPDHHVERTCEIQIHEAFNRLLDLIDAKYKDLPHRLHGEECGWCHRVPPQEHYRERLRESYQWAGVEVPSELAKEGK